MEFLLMPVPVWVMLAIQASCLGLCALVYHRIQQRLRGHAESIANMDIWADDVDEFIRRSKSLERQKVMKYAIDPRIQSNAISSVQAASRYRRNAATSH